MFQLLQVLFLLRIKRYRRKRRGVDYNAEIPFERKPGKGKWKLLQYRNASIKFFFSLYVKNTIPMVTMWCYANR